MVLINDVLPASVQHTFHQYIRTSTSPASTNSSFVINFTPLNQHIRTSTRPLSINTSLCINTTPLHQHIILHQHHPFPSTYHCASKPPLSTNSSLCINTTLLHQHITAHQHHPSPPQHINTTPLHQRADNSLLPTSSLKSHMRVAFKTVY